MKVRLGSSFVISISLAAVGLLSGAYFGVAQWMGTHPFWATQVVILGTAIGATIVFALTFLRLGIRISMVFALIFLGVTLGFTSFGKARFGASFAENGAAGKVWYYGSIATSAGLFLCLFVAIFAILQRLNSLGST